MFKIAKLEKVDYEDFDIHLVTQNKMGIENGKSVLKESFKILSFDISGTSGNNEYNGVSIDL